MQAITTYLSSLQKKLSRGDATEHTYRSDLQDLLETLLPGFTATNEAKRKVYGAPDFIISKERLDIGHLEVKDIGVNLEKVLKTDQWRRYTQALGNLILSDYLEFRWFVRGKLRRTVRLAEVVNGKMTTKANAAEEIKSLLEAFVQNPAPAAGSSKELAERLAYYAQQIRAVIRRVLREELTAKTDNKPLTDQFRSIQEILVAELTREEFADLYAQTLTYGLFATRIQQDEPDTSLGELSQFAPDFKERAFSRVTPLLGIRGNAVLTQIFTYFGGANAHPDFVWALEEVAMVLDHANMESIKSELGKATGAGDPVLHFYESFLASYDKAMREKRGVYYTPEPVVSYIVRSVDFILKTRFNLKKGLADSSQTETGVHKVQILDPATGTGTFLNNVINHIYAGFSSSNQGMWNGYVKNHLLPRIHGFEFLIAPYTLAHLKLDFLLSRTGYKLEKDERVRVFLTNTLEEPRAVDENFLPLAAALQREALEASGVKRDTPVMVVLGNPPYSGHSANKGAWIHDLLHGKDSQNSSVQSTNQTANYFEVDGMPLGEANPKYLNDDYVKFIRFAQWRIDRTGAGILAFVTNHGYLDNPTFRGMRQALLNSFDELYFLDLHGNNRKKETAPDGSKDENVFDIMQGVAIGIFVKLPPENKTMLELGKRVFHADLWGLREAFTGKGENAKLMGGKYHWLAENDLSSTQWEEVTPSKPFYLFVPQNVGAGKEYLPCWGLQNIFSVSVNGFKTHRDHFAIAFDKTEIQKRIVDLLNSRLSDDEIREQYDLKDNSDWQLKAARATLKRMPDWQQNLIPCDYRPFDQRWCYFHEVAMDRPRRELTQHVLNKKNLCLLSSRQQGSFGYQHVFISDLPANDTLISNKSSEAHHTFPLYLYPEIDGLALGGVTRQANLSAEFLATVNEKTGLEYLPDGAGNLETQYGPEDVLHYIYAVLHSPTYRTRYAEFLKIDFPRIPVTSKPALFVQLVLLGRELTSLHLLTSDSLDEENTTVTYPHAGLNVVDKPRYVAPNGGTPGQVFINDTQCFSGIAPELWAHRVGGYQVLEKWLKDRKGRELSFDDITHYTRVCAALQHTRTAMLEIDGAVMAAGGFPIV